MNYFKKGKFCFYLLISKSLGKKYSCVNHLATKHRFVKSAFPIKLLRRDENLGFDGI